MSSTHAMRIGDKGRTVVPLEVRKRFGWTAGTTLIAVEGADQGGLLILSQADARAAIRSQLAGHDVVADLLAERRAAAAREEPPA